MMARERWDVPGSALEDRGMVRADEGHEAE
jgi:hypothetical protein